MMEPNLVNDQDKTLYETEERSMNEVVDLYVEQNDLGSSEGWKGVENLCKLVRAMGYKDTQYLGQFNGGSIGDLIEFLKDNSGCIDAIVEWIGDSGVPEWKETLEAELEHDEDDEE